MAMRQPTNSPGVAAGNRKGSTVSASAKRICTPPYWGMGKAMVSTAYTAASMAARVRSRTENLDIKKPPFSSLENGGTYF